VNTVWVLLNAVFRMYPIIKIHILILTLLPRFDCKRKIKHEFSTKINNTVLQCSRIYVSGSQTVIRVLHYIYPNISTSFMERNS